MTPTFFETNSYFIDEKVNFLKFENAYKVYNDKGEYIGSIVQKLTFGQKMLRLILNKAMLPFHLEIRNAKEEVEATISRGWTFFMSKIEIQDSKWNKVGFIQQKFKFFKPTFKIFNKSQNQIAEITGDWKAWNFEIKDLVGNQIGIITKKWAGAVQEIFTTADKYNVVINPNFANLEHKICIVSCAVTIDMVMKESK